MAITCNDSDFLTSARTYRKELLQIPVHRLADSLDQFTIRPGIRYEEKVIGIDPDMQFGPYDSDRTASLVPTNSVRTLKTYFGSVRREFDPNQYYKTILGSAITKGEELKSTQIALKVLEILSGKLGDHLSRSIFNAVRNDNGTLTADLFDGIDTITQTEITNSKLTTALGNLHEFTAAITDANAVDSIVGFCRAADDLLISQPNLNLFLDYATYYAYLDDYKSTTGAAPYNTEFAQLHPEGFPNITFRPMFQKKDSKFIQLTTKPNMLIGVNQTGEDENIIVEKHDVVKLSFFATIFFGTNFESIDKERLLVGKFYEAPKQQAG